MQKKIGWTNPPPEKTSSEQIGEDILEMIKSVSTMRSGTVKPSDIQDGEIWAKLDGAGVISGLYQWRLADGDGDGTYIPVRLSATIRDTETASNTEAPTEKAVALGFESKADKDLGNVTNLAQSFVDLIETELPQPETPVAYITETWKSSDGSSWYRKWSDGFIEQGGRKNNLAPTFASVSFLTNFNNVNSIVILAHPTYVSTTAVAANSFTSGIYNVTISSFKITDPVSQVVQKNISWYAAGY